MNWWDPILKALKFSPRYLAPVFAVCAVLLFAPPAVIDSLGATHFVADYRGWIGLALLVSGALVVSHVLSWGWSKVKASYNRRRFKRNGLKYLENLTPDERRVLAYYIAFDTKSQMLEISDGVTNGLRAVHIIRTASQLGDLIDGFAHNIQPWAWEALKKNPKLLEPELSEMKQQQSQYGNHRGW